MCIFYDTKGKKIEKLEFIKLYSSIYYFKNAIAAELPIEKLIYNSGKRTPDDYITFLRWKVGGKIDDKGEYIICQSGEIDIAAVKELAIDADTAWATLKEKEIYARVIGRGIDNIGPVYALALVFFITRGREPIYDRYARMALDAIVYKQHKFRKSIKYKELPNKHNIDAVMKNYNVYKDDLTYVFGDAWKYERDIDCALWAYGHLFA